MRGQAVHLIALATLLACGPQASEPEVSFRTCGEDGPIPLLSKEGMFPVHAKQRGEDVQVWLAPLSQDPADVTDDTGVWLVDACGGNARPVSSGEAWTERIAGEWVTCEGTGSVETGRIMWLDPAANYEPTVVFEDVFCEVTTTAFGWIARRADGMLLLGMPSVDPEAPHELGVEADAIPASCSIGFGSRACATEGPWISGPSAYVVDRSGALVKIHLDEGGATEVLADATWAESTPDGMGLFWQAPSPSVGEHGAVHWRDTSTDEDVLVYVGPRPRVPDADEWSVSEYALVPSSPPQLLDLQSLALHELPVGARSVGIRPGPRTLIFGDEQSYAWDEEQSRAIPLGPIDAACAHEWGSEGYDRVRCEDGGTQLWSTPYDGGDARRIATGVTGRYFRHIAGQVVWSTDERTVVDGDTGGFFVVGELRLADGPEDSVLLARDARLISGVVPELEGDVLYVTHHEGEAPTLWRTSTD